MQSETMSNEENPTEREIVLTLASERSIPETCEALEFRALVRRFGDRARAQEAIRRVWDEGLVEPVGVEADPDDRALYSVPMPTIIDELGDRARFQLSLRGYEAVGRLHEFEPRVRESLLADALEPETADERLVVATAFINETLFRAIERHPEGMLQLSPRQFEEFVAEMFSKEGFHVELTPTSRDGGRDLLAVRHASVGSHLYVVECKRYAPQRPVGVHYVRSLYGVLEEQKATHGIIASTSYFTRGAKQLAGNLKWRVSLRDFGALKQWLSRWRGGAGS